jgi:Ner family transcriptional regulator
MAQPGQDWHREDIKAAVRRTGLSMEALARRHGLARSSCAFTLIRPWPRVQAIIADHLGITPQVIWPSRYDAEGNPLPHREIVTAGAARDRQIGVGA